MADNTRLPIGTADGDIYASDDIGGVKYQRVKLVEGADGVNDGDISAANPLPVAVISGGGTGGTANADDADFTAGTTSGTPVQGVYESSPTSVTDGDLGTVGITVTRAMKVSDATAQGILTTMDADTGGILTAVQIMDDWDESDRAKVNPIVGQAGVQGGSGAVSALTQRVVLATDVALPAGTNAIGKLAANSGVDIGDVDVTSISAGTNLIGDVSCQPRTSGGFATPHRSIDLDNGTLEVVKGSAGQVYGWTITNTTTATVYVKFYDATSGTLGTGTPVLTIGIPGNATDDTTLAQSFGGIGIPFATGICVGAGTGVADADNTDPGANGVIANIFFK